MSKNILVTCELTAEALALLKSQSQFRITFSEQRQPTIEEMQTAHAMIIRSGSRIYKELIDQAKALEFVVTATSGFDHIDFQYCALKNIPVHYCPSANTESAAQLTIAMILNLLRQLPKMHQRVEKNQWRENVVRGLELTGLQLGIVGFGRIGSRVAELAKAFHMQVVAHDPYIDTIKMTTLGVEPQGLMEIFKTSDVISFHVPLTKETKHLVNHRTLAHCNPEAFIINASRGAIIDETELAVRMRDGLFSGAAFDVFEREPLPKESPLRALDNVIFSPHIGAWSQQAFERASMEAAKKLCAFYQNQPIEDCLPPQVEWAKHL